MSADSASWTCGATVCIANGTMLSVCWDETAVSIKCDNNVMGKILYEQPWQW